MTSAKLLAMPKSTTPGVTVLLTQLTKLIYRRASDALLGMSVKEFSTLAVLRDHSSVPQQELGELLCVDANNLVLLLNDLEAREFAFRRRDPSDRRRHLVEITDEGLRAFDSADKGIESVEGEVLALLTKTERVELHELLAKALE
jgi:DNA-binding MarR family transcriptional regulator